MLNLNRGGYSAGVVALALHSPWGDPKVTFRYDLLDRNLNVKRTLANVRTDGNSVTMNALDDIKRKAKFSLVDDGTIDFLADRIKPHMLLWVPPVRTWRQYAYLSPWQITETGQSTTLVNGGWVEFPLGVFIPSSPEVSEGDGGALLREVDAYDQTVMLKNYRVSGKYLIRKGTSFVDSITNGLLAAGALLINITPSDKVMPFDREWETGTTMLQIVNDMLEALNYYSIWFDEEGVATGTPYVLPEQAASEYTYADDDRSVIARPVKRKLDTFDVPNQWVYYTSEAAQTVPLRSIYTNDNPNSPLSTTNRGMTITETRQVEVADQATLDSLVQRAYNDSLSLFEHVSWSSWVLPQHSFMDSYTFTYRGMGISAKYREVSWSMDLHANGVMQHEARRSVSLA